MPILLKAVFFTLAFICFLLESFRGGRAVGSSRADIALLPLGLAFFTFPFVWDAWDSLD